MGPEGVLALRQRSSLFPPVQLAPGEGPATRIDRGGSPFLTNYLRCVRFKRGGRSSRQGGNKRLLIPTNKEET